MPRFSKKDIEKAVSELSQELGLVLKLEAWSPGDKHGTRYRVYLESDSPDSLGRRVFAECGAQGALKGLWIALDFVRLYKEMEEKKIDV